MKFPSISLLALAASVISPVAVVAQSNVVFKVNGADVSIPVSSQESYNSGQDENKKRPLVVAADGRAVTVEGNTHRALPLPQPLTIQASTTMELDVTIGDIQEAQALCIDENTSPSAERCFVFAHTQDLSSTWHVLETQTPEGETRHYSIPIGHYFWGVNKYNYFAYMQDNDSSNRDAGSMTISNIEISDGAEYFILQNGLRHYINSAEQKSFGSNQDSWQYGLQVSEDGKSLEVKGNMHRAVPLDAAVTIDINTDLDMDFTLEDLRDIHAICFSDAGLSDDNCIVAANTQSWGKYNLTPKTQVGETRHYSFPIGLLFQGTFDHLMFMQDNDTGCRSCGDATWANVELKQVVRPTLDIMVDGVTQKLQSTTAVSARDDQDSKTHFLEFPDEVSVTLKGNIHKALTITEPFEITSATELDFDFNLVKLEEHHTICVVTDPNNIASYTSGKRCYSIAWTQNNSWDENIEPQTHEGETRHYSIPIGLSHPGGTAYYLVFIQDNDANRVTGESTFSNIQFSERAGLQLNINGADTGIFNHQFSYGSRQDFEDNLIQVSNDGKSASLYGNLWKAMEFAAPVTITDNTVLSFTLEIEQELEIVSICFDNNFSDQKQARCFKLSGYQNTHLGSGIIYKGIKQTYEGETKDYMIRLKEFYTGDFKYIAFQHDNDGASRHDGISHFSNIALYEMEPSCLNGGNFNFDVTECTIDNFVAGVQSSMDSIAGCAGKSAWRELLSLWDGQSDSDVRNKIEHICVSANTGDTVSFNMLLNSEKQFVEEFFDGGNKWNYEVDEAGGPDLTTDASRITVADEKFGNTAAISLPDVHNFEGCELRAAMCCYVAARDADSSPTDNSDACYMEFKNSQQSSHVRDGYSIYPDDSEGPFACHGFAWGDDSGYTDAAFKGNTLFDVAMKNGLYSSKEVEELPGAPMCGCVEHMPVVTRADCTKTTVTQTVSISFDPVSQFFAEASITDVAHEDCGDLTTHYSQLVDEGKATATELGKLSKHLVGDGQCGSALSDFLETKGFSYNPNSSNSQTKPKA